MFNSTISKTEVEENRKKALEREAVFKAQGYDKASENDFLIKNAGEIKGKILEIGTGKGALACFLAQKVEGLITVDISEKEQRFAVLNAMAANVLNKICFVACNAERLPYKDHYFDLVISVNAFHHFENPFAVMKEMIRVCRKKLVIADFNRKGFEIVRRIHKSEGGEHEERGGDFSIIGAYLKEHSFEVKQYEGNCQLAYVAERKA